MSQLIQNPNKTRMATHFFEVSKFYWSRVGEGKNTVWGLATKDLSAAPCMEQPVLVHRADGRKTHQKCGALLLKNNKIQIYENLGKYKKPSKETIPHIKVYAGSDDALDVDPNEELNHQYYKQLQAQVEEMIEIEKFNADFIQEQQETQKQVKKLKVFG